MWRKLGLCDGRFGRRTSPTGQLLLLLLWTMVVAALLPVGQCCFPGGRLIRRLPKRDPPLVHKQHVPNVPENDDRASGAREGPIQRGDKRFQELIVNYNPDINFKDEEGTGEDRIMSARSKEKLDALAMLVMNFWPGVKLRVTEAWDQTGFHSPDSLHYEGRAVDITTSDRDRNKYGMLARLASQAGFDWVYYENRAHVHASVKSDSVTRQRRMLKCFPGEATVLTSSGERKRMADLRLGDRVAVGPVSFGGQLRFQPIIAFLHRDETMDGDFVRLSLAGGAELEVSAEHLLPAAPDGALAELTAVAAGRLAAGDRLAVSDANRTLTLRRVVSASVVRRRGVYAPLTEAGNLLVDDVLASCYAAVRSDRLAHGVLAPLRLWHRVTSLVGLGPVKGQPAAGVHWYARGLLKLADWLQDSEVWQVLDVF